MFQHLFDLFSVWLLQDPFLHAGLIIGALILSGILSILHQEFNN